MYDVELVNKVDRWSQDNDSKLDELFQEIYEQANNTGYGWESVKKSSPELFEQALALAMENENKL